VDRSPGPAGDRPAHNRHGALRGAVSRNAVPIGPWHDVLATVCGTPAQETP